MKIIKIIKRNRIKENILKDIKRQEKIINNKRNIYKRKRITKT